MKRLFCDAPLIEGEPAVLSDEDLHHVKNVLRMQAGESVQLIDPAGNSALGTVREEGGFALIAGEVTHAPLKEEGGEITLYMGLAKGEKFELIVQKAVELGAARIVPVSFSRCVVKLNGKDAEKKVARWNKIARSAAMQSGRLRIPEVTLPITMKELYEAVGETPSLLAYELERERSIGDGLAMTQSTEPLALIVGPEGGIDEREAEELIRRGAISVSLGTRILRCETAPLALLSVAQFVRGGMDAPGKESL